MEGWETNSKDKYYTQKNKKMILKCRHRSWFFHREWQLKNVVEIKPNRKQSNSCPTAIQILKVSSLTFNVRIPTLMIIFTAMIS